MITKSLIYSCFSLVSLAASAVVLPPKPCYPEGKTPFAYPQVTPDKIEAKVIASDLKQPRSLAFDENGRLIVVELGAGISVFTYSNDEKATCKGWEKSVLVDHQDKLQLTHGLAVRGSHVYASSEKKVYRWDYDTESGTVTGAETVIVNDMPTKGHNTRTLVLSPRDPTADAEYLIVHAGSETVKDALGQTVFRPEGYRAEIRAFALAPPRGPGSQPLKPGSHRPAMNWMQGRVVARGLRDAVGMSLGIEKDSDKLWVTENSYDEVAKAADELDLINFDPPFDANDYGFPDCYAVFDSTQNWKGDQVSVDPGRGVFATCDRKVPPRLIFPPHSSPHGLAFYEDVVSSTAKQALPNDWKLGAFIPFRGHGAGIVHVPFDKKTAEPSDPPSNPNSIKYVLNPKDATKCPDQCLSPSGVAFQASQGRLFGTSDQTGELFVIQSVAAA